MPEQETTRRRSDALEYMQAMLGQLRTMAAAERCDMLAYLIEMAFVEARDIATGERPLPVGRDERDPASGVALEPAGKVEFQ